jgi:REP element-mobilizing transposase RayT
MVKKKTYRSSSRSISDLKAYLVLTTKSVKVNKEFSEHLAKFFWKAAADSKGEFWNDSYAIESVGGANIEVLERYIRNQDAPRC